MVVKDFVGDKIKDIGAIDEESFEIYQIATWLHDTYEEVAGQKKWNTQESCKVRFDDLPEKNKETMLEVAKRLFKKLKQEKRVGTKQELERILDLINECYFEEENGEQILDDLELIKELKKRLKELEK
jgi:hypothetical protein